MIYRIPTWSIVQNQQTFVQRLICRYKLVQTVLLPAGTLNWGTECLCSLQNSFLMISTLCYMYLCLYLLIVFIVLILWCELAVLTVNCCCKPNCPSGTIKISILFYSILFYSIHLCFCPIFEFTRTHTLSQLSDANTHVQIWSLCKAFMVYALSVHFSGAGPRPAGGLLPAADLRFSLSATDKKNLPEQWVQLCTWGSAGWLGSHADMHKSSLKELWKQTFLFMHSIFTELFDSMSKNH